MDNRALFRYRFGNAEFDEARNTLTVGGKEVNLERRPQQLLLLLLRHAGQYLSKDQLLEQIWGLGEDGNGYEESVLTAAVGRLRTALGPENRDLVKNKPRMGYCLTGDVDRIPVGTVEPIPLNLRVGEPVPHRDGFKLVRNLAKGGRYNVWLAQHTVLGHKRVFKFATDSHGFDALEREYTLLRAMDKALDQGLRATLDGHPGLVTLLHGNFTEEPYFLEFEYGGDDLPTWARAEPGLGSLDQAARLDLFLQLARVVAVAHSLGVIHKDLKPTNVLVAGEPGRWEVRLADFGSGQALDMEALGKLELTLHGLTVSTVASPDSDGGTPHYLAPEVTRGQPFTLQTDVFALGLILFQLLTGDFHRRPLPGWDGSIEDEAVREVIAAATRSEPDVRLRSAGELVQRLSDLERRREELAECRAQEARLQQVEADRARARALRPAYHFIAAVVVTGAATTAWFGWSESKAKRVAEAEAGRAQAISDFMTKDVLRSADISRVGTTESITMYDVLRRASELAGARFANQPLTEAVVRCQLGDVMVRSVAASAAIKEYKTATSKLEQLRPAPETELLRCRFGLAQALADNDQAKEAEAVLQEAEKTAGVRLQGPTSDLTLIAMRARHVVLLKLKRVKDALPIAQKLVADTHAWSGADASDRFEAMQALAEDYLVLGDEPSASKLLATLSQPPYSAETIGAVTYARARVTLGQAMIARGDADGAIKVLREAQDVLTAGLGPKHYHVGLVNYELANALSLRGVGEEEATQCLQKALTAFTASVGKDHGHTVTINMNLGVLDISVGRSAEGLQKLDDARPFLVKRGFPTDAVDFHRARALVDLGRFKEALAIFDVISVDALIEQHKDEAPLAAERTRLQFKAEHGRALAGAGQRDRGRKMLAEAIDEMHKIGVDKVYVDQYRVKLAKL